MTLPALFILAMLLYGWRFLGFALPLAPAAFGQRFFQYLPISLFTALVVMPLYTDASALPMRLLALLMTGIIMQRTQHLGGSVIAGLALIIMFSQFTTT